MTLPRRSLTEAAIDPAGVVDLVAACAAEPGLDLHSLLILRERHVCFEAHWAPYRAGDRQLIYSLSKLFTSAATGIAVADGRFGYDDTVADLLVDGPAGLGPKARSIRIRDCLGMATGHTVDLDLGPGLAGPDLSGWAWWLGHEPDGIVGETFCYNQWAPYSCSAAISRTSGASVHDLLAERVFGPLGVDAGFWTQDAGGRSYGYSGLHLPPESIAAFAQLVDDGGVLDGDQVLPPEWLLEHQRLHTRTPADGAPDWRRGYGWQTWLSRHGYRGDGAFGQFCLFVPEVDLIVVITSAAVDAQRALDLLWEHLLPAVDREPSADEGELVSAARFYALAMPPDDGRPAAGTARPLSGATPARPGISCTVEDGPDGWTLTWADPAGGSGELAVGRGEWRRGVLTYPGHELPVAAAGGWRDGEFTCRLVFTSTPHVAVVTVRDGDTDVAWETAPLGGDSVAALALTSGRPV